MSVGKGVLRGFGFKVKPIPAEIPTTQSLKFLALAIRVLTLIWICRNELRWDFRDQPSQLVCSNSARFEPWHVRSLERLHELYVTDCRHQCSQ